MKLHATACLLLIAHHVLVVCLPLCRRCFVRSPLCHMRSLTSDCMGQELSSWGFASMACSWPAPAGASDRYTRIVVLADPQLTDKTSYELLASGPLLWAVELLCDAYLARAGGLMRAMKPHAVLYLGDLMDGGTKHSDAEFQLSLERLERVLSPPISSAVIHVAGNHDTG